MAKYIIESRNKPRAFNTESEKHDILQKAALLIKADIRDKNFSREYYPTSQDITDGWIHESLKMLVSEFSDSEVKQDSIGQAIVKLMSPH